MQTASRWTGAGDAAAASRGHKHFIFCPQMSGWGGCPMLPGIAGGNPTAGGVKPVGVDERGVDLAQVRNSRKPEVIARQTRIRAEQPFDCACDRIHTRQLIEPGGGDVASDAIE